MHFLKLIFISIFVFSASSAFAELFKELANIQHTETEFPGVPEVAEFTVHVKHKIEKFSFNSNMPYYFSKMVAKIETHNSEDLKEFAVVQFNRGCIYSSEKLANGAVKKSFSFSRVFFGKSKKHVHPEWVIDSVDKDPIYWSSQKPTVGRIGPYRLDDPMLKAPYERRKFFYKDYKEHNKFYISDIPTPAYNQDAKYSNPSMEFRTCLYRITDLPAEIDPIGKELLGKEIKCFYWQHNFIFNHESGKYEERNEIDSQCLADIDS